MPFDIEKYRATEYERRTELVPVPALAAFFDEGEDPGFTVHSLTGPEVYRAEQRIGANRNVEGLVAKLVGGNSKDAVDAILEKLGVAGSSVPDALVKAIAYVEFGVASAALSQNDVVRMAEYHIDTFLSLFNTINRLTALGHVPVGESTASGATPGCETPSPCAPEAPPAANDSSGK